MNPDPCEAVLVALRRIARAIDLHSKRLVQRYGLTGPQALVLRNLLLASEQSVGELARRISLSQATVTDILDRLEKRALVQRTRSTTDKRRVLVRATADAKALGDALPLLQESFVAEFRKLEEWEQTLILSSLQRVASMMETRTSAVGIVDMPALAAEPLLPGLSGTQPDQGASGVTSGS